MPLATNAQWSLCYNDQPTQFNLPELVMTINQPSKRHIWFNEITKITKLMSTERTLWERRRYQRIKRIETPGILIWYNPNKGQCMRRNGQEWVKETGLPPYTSLCQFCKIKDIFSDIHPECFHQDKEKKMNINESSLDDFVAMPWFGQKERFVRWEYHIGGNDEKKRTYLQYHFKDNFKNWKETQNYAQKISHIYRTLMNEIRQHHDDFYDTCSNSVEWMYSDIDTRNRTVKIRYLHRHLVGT